jgi:hypothetical protein
MELGNIAANLPGLLFQISATVLFGLVFLFLWRHSKIVYFGLWSAAWAARSATLPLAYAYLATRTHAWLTPFALMEFVFTVLLFAAGGAGFSGPIRNWRSPLKIVLIFPILLGLAYVLGTHPRGWLALNAAALSVAYLYNYTGIRSIGVGGRAFRFSLLGLAAVYLYDAVALANLSMGANHAAAGWTHMLEYSRLCSRALQAALTFAALAMWIENQQQRLKALGAQFEREPGPGRSDRTLESRGARPADPGDTGFRWRHGSVRHRQLQGSERPLRALGRRRDFAQHRSPVPCLDTDRRRSVPMGRR